MMRWCSVLGALNQYQSSAHTHKKIFFFIFRRTRESKNLCKLKKKTTSDFCSFFLFFLAFGVCAFRFLFILLLVSGSFCYRRACTFVWVVYFIVSPRRTIFFTSDFSTHSFIFFHYYTQVFFSFVLSVVRCCLLFSVHSFQYFCSWFDCIHMNVAVVVVAVDVDIVVNE